MLRIHLLSIRTNRATVYLYSYEYSYCVALFVRIELLSYCVALIIGFLLFGTTVPHFNEILLTQRKFLIPFKARVRFKNGKLYRNYRLNSLQIINYAG